MSLLNTRSIAVSLAFWLVCTTTAFAQSSRPAFDEFSLDTLLVQFKPGTPANSQADAHRSANATLVRTLRGSNVQLLKVQPGSVNNRIEAYRRNPNIEYAEKNYRRVIYLPSTNEGEENPTTGLEFDNFNEQWNLENSGQEFGLTRNAIGNLLYPSYEGAPDADIDAPEAWNISHGDSGVTIAILDTGVACDHLDLDGKCVESVNFVDNHGSPIDDLVGHGTHVAGIAAAITNNGVGIAGVGWDTSIAALKTCFEIEISFGVFTGYCDDADVIEAINHARMVGHQVISMSFAGSVPNPLMQQAIDLAWANGAILVAAAGNIYTDDILYPAGYNNVISVGSTDHQDNLSAFSNHGAAASVLAPGTHIVSTVPGGFCYQADGVPSDCYDTKSGTSMAAPHVAGLVALMVAEFPTASNAEIRGALEASSDTTGALMQNMQAWSTHGRINMQAALATNPTDPGDPTPTMVQVQSAPIVSTVNAGKGRKFGKAVVVVVDNLGDVVSGAQVNGHFSAPFSDASSSDTTGSDGVAEFQTPDSVKGGVTFEFCVDSIVYAALNYQATGNECMTF